MKKIILTLLSLFIMAVTLPACTDKSNMVSSVSSNSEESDKISIVTTIFPEYDWVREILGNNLDSVDLTMMSDNGVDLHSYQPTADDIIKITNCDLFIYVGGESDDWIDDALSQAENKDMVVINLLDTLGDYAKKEEITEGMETEKNADHEDTPEYDEHVWLSLKNAEVLCQAIADQLSSIDPDHKDIYDSNATSYIEKLSALDSEYHDTVDHAQNDTILFGDRFPFRYLVDDYGLNYYAAFSGCSAETEASFETITFLAKKVDELKLPCVLTIENGEQNIAKTIISNTSEKNQKILIMDSLQSTTSEEIKDGITYLSIMEKNLEVLKEALE